MSGGGRATTHSHTQHDFSRFNEVVQKYFPDFEKQLDLGYVCYTPKGGYQNLREVAANDFKNSIRLGAEALPLQLCDVDSLELPVSFYDLPPRTHQPLFPHNPGLVVPAHAAVQAGLDLDSIDFVLGDCVLGMFSHQWIAKESTYLVQRYKNVVYIVKHKPDQTINLTDWGHQLQRLVTGVPMNVRIIKDSNEQYEHVQVVRIGKYRALISAPIGAVSTDGSPLDIKMHYPHMWGKHRKIKLALQMVSSGSLSLIRGILYVNELREVQQLSLDQVFLEAPQQYWTSVSDRISYALNTILERGIPEEDLFEIIWHQQHFPMRYEIELKPVQMLKRTRSVLPCPSVVAQLLQPPRVPKEEREGWRA